MKNILPKLSKMTKRIKNTIEVCLKRSFRYITPAFLILNQKADFKILLLHGFHKFSKILKALMIAAKLGCLF
jgi:hypothetical protein